MFRRSSGSGVEPRANAAESFWARKNFFRTKSFCEIPLLWPHNRIARKFRLPSQAFQSCPIVSIFPIHPLLVLPSPSSSRILRFGWSFPWQTFFPSVAIRRTASPALVNSNNRNGFYEIHDKNGTTMRRDYIKLEFPPVFTSFDRYDMCCYVPPMFNDIAVKDVVELK